MFIRKKNNKSGSVSVQIIDKSSGKYVVRETVGSSDDPQEISFLVKKGKRRILQLSGQVTLDFEKDKELEFVEAFMNSLEQKGWNTQFRLYSPLMNEYESYNSSSPSINLTPVILKSNRQ